MTLAVGVIVTFVVLFVLGYRFDSSDGRLERYTMLQFNSNPSGADVTVDGKSLSSQTPNKVTIQAGKHLITMSKTGYETWTKNVDAKSGVLTWLNYALLVPKKLTVEPIASYAAIYETLASPEGRYMLVEEQADTPVFNLVDLSSDTIRATKLTIPASLYSDATTADITHNFHIDKWDDGGRYVLIKHTYADKNEWLVLDTQDANLTKNITRLFDFAITSINFLGTSGNIFYALGTNDIRKIDLSAGTISRPLVSNVISFNIYSTNIIGYVGNGTAANQKIIGLYRDGDDNAHIIRTILDDNLPINIAAARYFNEYYVIISDGKKVDILSGSYPNSVNDASSLKALTSFVMNEDIQNLSISPTGEYILMQSGAYFASYDLEYQSLASTRLTGTGSVALLRWINDNYIWSDRDGSLTIREFDGTNIRTINTVATGQSATLTSNGRYLYSINKSVTDYQLQRVRMVLP